MEDELTRLAGLLWVGGTMRVAAPVTTRYTKHYELLIPIGKNHTASIVIEKDALKVLCNLRDMDISDLLEE